VDPSGPTAELPALPMVFDSQPSGIRRQPPKLGQHTEEIMRETGFSPEEIAALKTAGVIRSSD